METAAIVNLMFQDSINQKGTIMIKAYWSASPKSEILFSVLKFSGGELQVRILDTFATQGQSRLSGNKFATFHANLTSSDEIMTLILLFDALRRVVPDLPIVLKCPYLPYARQDRVCAPGESLAVRQMCELINGIGFTSVEVWDVHSDVSLALLDEVTNIEPHELMLSAMTFPSNVVFVAPDAGALKKVRKVAQHYKRPMVSAEKVRNVQTGDITGTKVFSDHIGDQDFMIVDDICDGGRTFIELAKELRPLTNGKIFLYVTHGIFSKGLDVFNGLIDKVYTANPFPDVDLSHPLLTVV